MKILIVGFGERAKELNDAVGLNHEITIDEKIKSAIGFDIIFDLYADEKNYKPLYRVGNSLLVLSAVKKTLKEISADYQTKNICGMNLLPGFINRNLKEVSFINEEGKASFKNFTESVNWKYGEVKDSVGMISPRVIAMIINEAAYTLEEGTATKEDIDKAMMLGTNYPAGPFAWCDKTGINHIAEILESLFADSKDERYKICNLLKVKNEKQEKFY